MSDSGNSPIPSAPSPGQPPTGMLPPRNGCLAAILALLGIVMLLPGLCAVYFGAALINTADRGNAVMPFVFVGGLIGLGGILLIWAAIRATRR